MHYIFAVQLGMIARALIESLLRLLNTHETLRFLAANRKNKKQDVSDVELANEDTKGAKKGKINAQLSELIEAEKSIWDEGEVPAKELQKGITTGTLNKLVLSISAESAYDNKLLKTFITTYRSFAAPYKLFQKLIERYNVPQGRAVDAKKIQTKVTIILKYAPPHTIPLIACPSCTQTHRHTPPTPRPNVHSLTVSVGTGWRTSSSTLTTRSCRACSTSSRTCCPRTDGATSPTSSRRS